MTPDEYRYESERAHERRMQLRKARELLADEEKGLPDRERRDGGETRITEVLRLLLSTVERLSFADERTLEMRRECSTMIEHCTKAIELEALRRPLAPIIIAREDLPAAIAAGVRDDTHDDSDKIG